MYTSYVEALNKLLLLTEAASSNRAESNEQDEQSSRNAHACFVVCCG